MSQVNRVESVSDDVVSEVKSIGVESLFFATTGAGLGLYIVIIITPFGRPTTRSSRRFRWNHSGGTVPEKPEPVEKPVAEPVQCCLCPLYYYHQKHPVNYFLLGVFTLALAFVVRLTCAFTNGKVILRSAILDKYLYNNPEMTLDWKQRSKIVKGVVGSGRDIHEFSDSQFGHVFAFEETRAMAIANLGSDRYDLEEVEMVLKLGLLCSHSDPRARPSMRLVLQYLRGDMSLPELTPLDLSAGNGMNLGGREGFSDYDCDKKKRVSDLDNGCGAFPHRVHLLATKRGYDFNFLGPFLFGALIVLIVFAMIQVTPLIPNSMP
ncbi:hypothetical protein HID58_079539 [Brassica napus]|uniref:Uncharacterized protein n=1 Tax=Brassica napus TaxID=3708 RepID=A0ABQ7Y2A6_BRANA|nr:hypothetical protein HID58_079539 [Brassica napus]